MTTVSPVASPVASPMAVLLPAPPDDGHLDFAHVRGRTPALRPQP